MNLEKIRIAFFLLLITSFSVLLTGRYLIWNKHKELINAAVFFPVYLDKVSLPQISLTDTNDKTITEKELSNGLFLLHFWATWCKSCEKELFEISRINKEGIKIICISVDEDPQEALRFVKERNLDINLMFDKGGNNAKILGTSKFPETYVINNGKVILKFEGPRNWTDENLIKFIYNSTIQN